MPSSKKLVSNRVRLLILTRQIYFTTSPPFSCFQGNFPAHIFKLGWDSLVHICSRGPIRKFPEFHERLLETNLQCWSAFVLLYASKEEETLSFERVTSSLFQPGFFNVLVCILFCLLFVICFSFLEVDSRAEHRTRTHVRRVKKSPEGFRSPLQT